MPVTDIHPGYALHAPEWKRTNDAAIGSPALRNNNAAYLPEPYAKDEPERYNAFCKRAYYVNLTGRTEKVLQGMVFRKDATVEAPPAITALIDNMDGNGEGVEQIAKNALSQRLRKNRFTFLVDFPNQESGLTEAEERAAGIRPVCSTYTAESLINWRWSNTGARKQLTLAVLVEQRNTATDEFGHDCEKQYRVLRLRDGVYTQELLDESGRVLTEEFAPLMAGGIPFDHIPLHGVRELEVAALQPVAEVNLAYYWNTAKVEDMVDLMGSPSLHINVGETSIAEWKEHNKSKFKFGSRSGTMTKNGSMDILQAAERPLIRTVRQDKMEELAAIGASIASVQSQAETAEAARIRSSSETSQLSNEVGDLSADIEAVLEDMARFIGVDPDSITYQLNTDFFDSSLTAQDLDAIIRGQILYGRQAALGMIRKGRVELPRDMTDEELLESASSDMLDEDSDSL